MKDIASMTIVELKQELIEFNDSSFVFNMRDELECALRSARKAAGGQKPAGVVAPSPSPSPSKAAKADVIFDDLPDMASLSSGSNASSLSSPSPYGQRVSRASLSAVSPILEGKDNDNGEGAPPPPPPPRASSNQAVYVSGDAPAESPQEVQSRRLVEYFVMVSSVPIDDQLAARANRKLAKSERPPDPKRDKMNSRTAARFDARRVHLTESNDRRHGSFSDSGPEESDSEAEGGGGGVGGVRKHARAILEPKITARYPAEDHPDQPLNQRLPQFCHPEGTAELIRPTTEYKMPRLHHFVLTDSMGGKQYGVALTVYEEFVEDDDSAKKVGDVTYYAPRVLVILSTYPYLYAFRTYLTQLYRLATMTDCMTVPIERYVQNICSEVPAPPPGAFEVQLSILGTDVRFWAPPASQPIPYVSLPFSIIFECLDIGNILFAWYTLACERKVLLVSSQLSVLCKCTEILCSLLFPMRWSHLYIPLLPRSLTPMLDAPMPYLCGISRENFPYAVEDISDETVVVDLDRNVITLGPNTPDLPPLPHQRRKKLESTLKEHAGDVFWEARNLSKADVLRVRSSGDERALSEMLDGAGRVWEEKVRARDDAFVMAYAPGSASLQFDEDANLDLDDGSMPKQSRWDAVQEAFLRFYVTLLQDYRKFLPSDASAMEERKSWRGGDGRGMSNLRFQKEEFVAASPSEFQPFLEELTMTQQFDDFVTRKMHNAEDAADIKFFDQSIDAKRNRSRLKLKKKETPFLVSASAHRDLKKIKAVEPNADGLPQKKFIYKTWPSTFDESLFGTPRRIPDIINDEFDRRTALRAMLRSKYGIVDDPRPGGRNRSAEATAFVLFFKTFTSVIGKEMSNVERKHGTGSIDEDFGGQIPLINNVHAGGVVGQSSKKLTDMDDDMEVARTIAKAQIDLGYHTLALMRARRLTPEPIAYKLLIQACGRTRVTHRASGLMEMLARDGLATNSEIYTSLITAFSNDGDHPTSLALHGYGIRLDEDGDNLSSLSSSEIGSNAANSTTNLITRRQSITCSSEHSLDLISENASDHGSSKGSAHGSATPSSKSSSSSKRGSRLSRLAEKRQAFKGLGAKGKVRGKVSSQASRLSSRKNNLKVTAAIAKQIELGESLLESLYPNIEIDTENVCPKCAAVLCEDDIEKGWLPCASNEYYQTECAKCRHGFVPKFSVSTSSQTFEGSQGRGTPLYCDHLSPWALLREIRRVIDSTGGIDGILDEKFRGGSDISATLWWNMVLLFRRYRLPYIFLLQGSFQNQLILPSPSLGEAGVDI